MTLAAILLLFAVFINLSLGLFVLLRNPRSFLGQSFAAISAFLTAWAVSSYLADNAALLSISSLSNRLAYVFAFLALASTVIFSHALKGGSPSKGRRLLEDSLLILTGVVFSGTNAVVGTVEHVDSQTVFTLGPFIASWSFMMLALPVLLVKNIAFVLHTDSKQKRQQARIIAAGMILTIVLTMLTNAILPAITANEAGISSFDTAIFGPLMTIFFVGSSTYAIVQYRLFDIRWALTRSVAYVLSILSFAGLFFLVLLLVVNPILPREETNVHFLLIALFSLIFGLMFLPIKKFFDKFTHKLFYHDTYSTREVLDRLGDSLVEQVDSKEISSDSLKILANVLQPSFAHLIILRKRTITSIESFNSVPLKLNPSDINLMAERHRLVGITELETNIHLKKVLRKLGVDVVLRLATKTDTEGLLVLGPRTNGSMYNPQDIELLTICGKNLGLAFANSKHYEEVKRFNETLLEKIELATMSLKKANRRLKKLDQEKDDFISATSHQLRPQLAAAKGFVDILEAESDGELNMQQRFSVGTVRKTIDRMIHIVSDLLENAVKDPGHILLRSEKTDVGQLVVEEVKSHKQQAEKAGVKLKVSVQKDLSARVDRVKIYEILANLLNNAIQYNKSGGVVQINARRGDGNVEIVVSDTGAGIDKQMLKNIFKKFTRGESAIVARPTGTGLGLYIARNLVKAHGGEIFIESELGKGTTVTVWLPVDA